MDGFRTLTLASALHVAEHMRAMDWECLRALTTIETAEIFALNRWQSEGAAWALFDDGVPVCIGGINQAVPWAGTAWFLATDAMSPASWKKVIRHCRKVFHNASKMIARIDAHILSTWPAADRFARSLNFEFESVRRRSGRDGQDIITLVYQDAPCEPQKSP